MRYTIYAKTRTLRYVSIIDYRSNSCKILLQVRKDGYRAITQVSRELKKLVKRNADVLVQLLQSGE